MKYKIKVIKPLGFCYGVKRAVNIAEQSLSDKSNRKIYSLGDIIHNKNAVKELSKKGLIIRDNLRGIKRGDSLIVSSHGTKPGVLNEARRRGIRIIDATCPNVITSQRLCQKLRKQNYLILIVGDKRHREIEALRGFAGKKCILIKDAKEARDKKIVGRRIGVVVQTTQSKENFTKVLKEAVVKDYVELKIFNTICNDTSTRQKAALKLAKEVDMMFVVGGKHSANTRRLFELCRGVAKKCYYIENEKELKTSTLRNAKAIGLVSGASTPHWVIKNVIKKISAKGVVY